MKPALNPQKRKMWGKRKWRGRTRETGSKLLGEPEKSPVSVFPGIARSSWKRYVYEKVKRLEMKRVKGWEIDLEIHLIFKTCPYLTGSTLILG